MSGVAGLFRRPLRRAAPRLAVVTTGGLLLGVATWYGCSIYQPSLLLSGTADGGTNDATTQDSAVVDSGKDTAVDAGVEASPPTCPDLHAPGPPAMDDPSDASDQSFVVALHSIDIGLEADGGPPPLFGYDLDNVYTCCDGGPESCTAAVTGSKHCDENGGRDNSGGQLLQGFASLDPTEFNSNGINARLETGFYSILFQVLHYNGQANDTQVTVALYTSDGVVAAPDAGGAADAAVVAAWNGTDIWSIDPAFVLTPDASPLLPNHYTAGAYVSGGVLVVPNVAFPISLGISQGDGLVVSLTGGVVTGDVVGTDSGTYRMRGGEIAGRWLVSDLLTALGSLKFGSVPLCRGSLEYEGVKAMICPAADIMSDPTKDKTGATCDAISIGFAFTADPGNLGPVGTSGAHNALCSSTDAAPDDCSNP
jgi:hypothetical protein